MKGAISKLIKLHDKKLVEEYEKKSIRVSFIYLIVGTLSVALSILILQPIQWSHMLFLLAGILIGCNFEKIVTNRVNHLKKSRLESHGN